MDADTLDLESLWTGWLWTLGVAACPWPLTHPIADVAAAALRRHDRSIRRAARAVQHVAGLGPVCEEALERGFADLLEHGPWGEDEDEVHALAEAAAHDTAPDAEPADVLHRAQVASLERLLAEIFRLRAHVWEKNPARVERSPVSRLALVGAVAAWVVQPRWRAAAGPEAVRRAMKRVVDGRAVLDRLDGGPPAGLERCVVEVHYWLRTGELGQPWMPQWAATDQE